MNLAPFYRWHDEMPAMPGSLLRSETLPVQKQMPAAAQAVRMLYSSMDQRWNSGPIAVSGTLFVPAADSPPEGWPLLAWAHGTLGIADVCAPSWTGLKDRDAAYINRWLEHGFAVVVSDYQGLGGPGPHPYSVWQAEGTSVLDAIRAAQALRPGLLANRVILAGQSQGGGAALGAAILSAAYAPELDIRAAVVTAPNSTFPDGPVAVPVRDSITMFLSFATGGLRADAPLLDDILSAKGRELLKVARQGCTGEIALKARELKVDSFMDLLAISRDALAALRMPTTDMPLAPVSMPLMIATGQADQTITPIRQYAVAAALCAAGNQVTWLNYAGQGHDGVLHGSLQDAFAFVQAHLDGQGAASNCSTLQPPGQPGAKNRTAAFNDD
ncbi:lipase [Pseudomonas daroniae]|uniref:Lipase n=1 Tax=Phytopseudomonas daroniae TaxID=2487519 RepID=A0A4Q9QKU9_9GAMM|nr:MULTISPECIES: lipase family protein [Pseudomonas]TBU79333.1 lipase [Pseudomonas daroniae]TBU80115.1 lipase [Pseudomonas sp. FRB 228]TBU91433.1 lipase [Pseudomonas daroniae]